MKSVLALRSTHRFSKVSVRRRVSKGPRAVNLAPKALRVGSEVEACTRNPVAGGVGEPPRMQEPLRSKQSALTPVVPVSSSSHFRQPDSTYDRHILSSTLEPCLPQLSAISTHTRPARYTSLSGLLATPRTYAPLPHPPSPTMPACGKQP